MKYKYIIFDMDGTIIDPLEGIVNALNLLCEKYVLPKLPFKDLGIIGPPMKKSLMRLYGFEEAEAAEYAKEFRNIYVHQTILQSVLYDGIKELFFHLHENGFQVGIATYKRTDCAEMIVDYFGLKQFIPFICGDTPNSSCSKSDIIYRCMEKMGVQDKKEVLMVGDTQEDANGAQQVGIDFCAVTYGYGYKKGDSISHKYVHTPLQLMDIVGGKK